MAEKQTTEEQDTPTTPKYAAGALPTGARVVERTKIYFPEVPEADKKPAVDLRYRYFPGDQSWRGFSNINSDFITSIHRLGTADNGMDILLCKFKSGVDVRDFGIFLGYVSPELK